MSEAEKYLIGAIVVILFLFAIAFIDGVVSGAFR